MPTCTSCGHNNPAGTAFCQSCGSALPHDDGAAALSDDALSLMLGLVCSNCDSYNDPGTAVCVLCGHALGDEPPPALQPAAQPAVQPPAPSAPPLASPGDAARPSWMEAPVGKPLPTANAMPAVDLKVVSAGRQPSLAAPAGSDPAIPVQPPAPPRVAPAALPAESSCPRCGLGTRLDDKFCSNCGQRLDVDDAASPPLVPGGTMIIAAAQAKAPAPPPGPAGTMMMPSLSAAGVAGLGAPQAAKSAPPSATMFFGAASVERFARLTLVKGHTQFGTQWRLQAGETVIGRSSGMVLFPDDGYMAPRHCRVEFRGEDLWIVPEDERNGVFVRIKEAEALTFGGDFVIGVQRLRLIGPNELPSAGVPTQDRQATRFLGSGFRDDAFALKRVFQDPRLEEVYFRPQRVLAIGRARCDVNFPDDPFLSGRHAQVTRTSTGAMLEDLGSRNGTFIRLARDRKLSHGDVVMIGEQVLRVEVSLSLARA